MTHLWGMNNDHAKYYPDKRQKTNITANKLVLINRFTGSQPSYLPQKLCDQKYACLNFVNNPSYEKY